MTLSLLEDEVWPGVVNTYKSCVIRRGHKLFSDQTGLSNFVMYSTMTGENYQESESQISTLPMICPRKFYF